MSLKGLMKWFKRNYPNYLENLNIPGCFTPPDPDIGDYEMWTWHHPESTKKWATVLRRKKKELEPL